MVHNSNSTYAVIKWKDRGGLHYQRKDEQIRIYGPQEKVTKNLYGGSTNW